MSAKHPISAKLLAFEKLLEVVTQLRSPNGGCPWDLAQTPETLIPYIIEEAFETVDAIRSQDSKSIMGELGDLLLQVVLQAQIASEHNQFTITEVAESISAKLIRRHPHVFGDVKINDLAEIHQNWEQIKATETGEFSQNEKLHRYARTLPPLMAAIKIITKISSASGLSSDSSESRCLDPENLESDFRQFQQTLSKISSQTTDSKVEINVEIKVEPKIDLAQAELGDLMFKLVALAQHHQLDAFAALQAANHRFIDNFF